MPKSDAYQAPASGLQRTDGAAVLNVRPFSVTGRLNRTYYVLYSLGAPGLFFLLGFSYGELALHFSVPPLPADFQFTGLLIMLPGLVLLRVIWAIRRSHDVGASGWLAIIAFIPVCSLVLWFARGTSGANEYGGQPPIAPWWLLVLGFVPVVAGVMMLLSLLGNLLPLLLSPI